MERLRDLPPEQLSAEQREALRALRLVGPLRASDLHRQRLWRAIAAAPAPRRSPLLRVGAGVALVAGAAVAALVATGGREEPAATGVGTPPTGPAPRRAPPSFRPPPSAPTAPEPAAPLRPFETPVAPPVPGGEVLWGTGFETGDRADWRFVLARPRPGYFEAPGTRQEIVAEPVRTGRFAMKLAIEAGGKTRVTYLNRDRLLPEEGYYGAWYRWPARHEAPTYWTIMSFRSRTDPDDERTRVENLWNVDIRNREDGEMALALWHGARRRHLRQPAPIAVPIDRWVHVEVYFKRSSRDDGRIAVFQDGTKIFDLAGIATAPSEWLSFMVASVGKNVTPSPAVLFVDDVAVVAAAAPPP